MDESARNVLLNRCAEVFMNLASGISEIVAGRDSINDSGEDIAPVLPLELMCSNVRRLVRSLETHDARLKCCFSQDQIEQIDRDSLGYTEHKVRSPS